MTMKTPDDHWHAIRPWTRITAMNYAGSRQRRETPRKLKHGSCHQFDEQRQIIRGYMMFIFLQNGSKL